VDFAEIRRLVVVAVFADDQLMQRLVLKGGNALNLIYHIGGRTSLDVDFSLADDFEDVEEIARRLDHALRDRFDSAGYIVFDFSLRRKPANPRTQPPTWGGYLVEFKIISRDRHAQYRGDVAVMQARSEPVSPGQKRTFRIEISKHEYCEPKAERDLDGYTIYAYTPAMIAIEKLRAICQQMPDYPLIPAHMKRARARDFYDIHAILTETGLDLGSEESLSLTAQIFAAKDVPLVLIARIPGYREYHRPDWPSVRDTVSGLVPGILYRSLCRPD
jgi:predicted nucleotidyltransferase component of viral defense system